MPPIPGRNKPLYSVPTKTVDKAPDVDPSLWEPKKLKLLLNSNPNGLPIHPKQFTVEAKVMGRMAVHVNTINSALWTVSTSAITDHIAGICHVSSEETAMRIGEFLWGNFCLAMRCTTKEELVDRLPPWVVRWCKACNNERTWVDHKQYERASRDDD